MELPNADEDLHNVDSTDEIEDPNIVHIGVIGDTVSSGCPSLSLCLSLSVCLSLSLYAGGYTGLSTGWDRLSLA